MPGRGHGQVRRLLGTRQGDLGDHVAVVVGEDVIDLVGQVREGPEAQAPDRAADTVDVPGAGDQARLVVLHERDVVERCPGRAQFGHRQHVALLVRGEEGLDRGGRGVGTLAHARAPAIASA